MTKPKNQRDQYSDNLKFILIHLVVIGHFTLELFANPVARGITNAIYSFHMPVFIFLSGYFSKNAVHHKKDITKILFTFFVFQAIWVVYGKATGLGYFQKNPFIPTHQNWYLLALFTWRLLIPYASFFPKAQVIAISIIAAFIVGATDAFGDFLSLHRTIYFLPIFVLGYYCPDIVAFKDRFGKHRIIIAIAFFSVLITIFISSYFSEAIAHMTFLGYVPRLGHHMDVHMLIARFLGFFSSITIGLLLLIIVPSCMPKIFQLGRNSMNPFLLHMFYVYPVVYLVKGTDSLIVAICAFSLLILITTFISMDKFNILMKPVTDLEYITSSRLFSRK